MFAPLLLVQFGCLFLYLLCIKKEKDRCQCILVCIGDYICDIHAIFCIRALVQHINDGIFPVIFSKCPVNDLYVCI